MPSCRVGRGALPIGRRAASAACGATAKSMQNADADMAIDNATDDVREATPPDPTEDAVDDADADADDADEFTT